MRLHDWPERLGDVLGAATTRAFRYGDHDCALHAADAAEALTGVDPAARYRGRYTTYLAGLALLRRHDGTGSLKKWADKLWTRVPPAMAQRGDWALVREVSEDGRRRFALAVVDGALLVGAAGSRLPRTAALICWRVE